MKPKYEIEKIGEIKICNSKTFIKIKAKYISGLTNIEGFSHLQIVWWANLTDDQISRNKLVANKLFKKGPDNMGVFATRSPERPNPIMISTIKVDKIDFDKGIIYTPFIDAESQTPVLDIKPYLPMERVKNCEVPKYFKHWPKWLEDTARFDWSNEINFK